MRMRIPSALVVIASIVLALGCSQGSGGGPDNTGTTFDLEGAWTANWGGANTMVFTKTVFVVSGAQNVSADILSFDNAVKKGMLKWTVHPAFAGEYENFRWSPSATPGNMDMILGTPDSNYSIAEAKTDSPYSATLVPKP